MVANHQIQGKGEVRQSLSTWKPAALGFSTPFNLVLMWEEAAIKDDVIEYDIEFNIIYIMRTHVVVAKLRYPPLTKYMSALQSHHSDHCFQR
ncbi:hypothetical protein C0Q77_24545 [Klebsiella pneumoniae]|nr:hypothetical protein [Klebsiella pneumoniae]